MRRAVVPLALVLALVSGVVLAEARLILLAPIAADGTDPQVQDNSALIRRFYAAVNEGLERGDTDPVSRLLDAEFVDHAPRPGTTADRAGLLQVVVSLHALAPDLRLSVLDVVAQGDRVAARVGIEGGTELAFLGLPIANTEVWGTLDVFRIEGRRLVEHWGEPATLAEFTPLLDVSAPVDRPTRKALTLERWSYAPDAGERWDTGLGFLVVLVDAGTLTIEISPQSSGGVRQISHGRMPGSSDDRPVATGAAGSLAPGDAIVVPQGNWVAVRNDGATPAVALAVRAETPIPRADVVSGAGGTTEETGIVRQALARGLTADLPARGVTLAIGRTSLAPGARFRGHRVDVAEMVAVESGALEVTADDGAAWVTSQIEGTHRADGSTIAAGDGVFAEAGTRAGYGASGDTPLGILLVRIGAVGTNSAEGEAPTAPPVATSA